MNNTMGNGSPNQQNKKKIIMLAIYATVILIVCLLAVFAVVSIVASIKDKKAAEEIGGDNDGSVAGFEAYTVEQDDLYNGYLLLLNEGSAQKTAEELTLIRDARPKNEEGDYLYYLQETGKYHADPTALAAFNEMVKAFYAESKDNNLFIRYALDPNAENYDVEFRLGTTFTLNYYNPAPNTAPINATHELYKWFYENCAKYGFVARYPANEKETGTTTAADDAQNTTTNNTSGSNVFRYVGVAHATYMKQKNLSLEAYIDLLKNTYASAGKRLRVSGADGQTYEVYDYASAGESTEIMVPSQHTYTVSGDGSSGYIVTVNRSVKKGA